MMKVMLMMMMMMLTLNFVEEFVWKGSLHEVIERRAVEWRKEKR